MNRQTVIIFPAALLMLLLCQPLFPQRWRDVDCSGTIDIVDALILARHYVGIHPELEPCGSEVIYLPDPDIENDIRNITGKQGGAIDTIDAKGITELETDSFYSCNMTGLDKFPDLKTLIVSNRDVRELKVLAGCKKLESLVLDLYGDLELMAVSGDKTIDDISFLAGLSSLKNLQLLANVEDFSPLEGLTSLESLDIISWYYLESVAQIPVLPALKELHLHSKLKDMDHLQKYPSLVHLAINDATSCYDISFLEGLSNLTHLELSWNRIENIEPLGALSRLETLNLSGNDIDDVTLLGKFSALTNLKLDQNNIEDTAPLRNLTSLTELDLGKNRIENIEALQGLTSLETLYLDNNRIKNISALGGLSSLEALYLNDNFITDISVLLELPSLKSVSLGIFADGKRMTNPLGLNAVHIIQILEDRGVIIKFSRY